MSEIPKAYEPQSVEDKWYQFWLDNSCFTADPARVTDKRPAYSIVIPPPNVTGMLHMGHVLNNTIQDILSRKARMDGKEVLWLPGTDHAGIATEGMVARQIWKDEKKSKRDIGREEFINRVWQWKEKHGGIIIEQLKKLGCSCDWTRERFTMDADYVRNVQRVFVDLYKKGLIYRGKRMVNWCPATQTALSDEEVEMKPQKGFMYHFKVQVAESLPGSSRGNEAQTEQSAIGNRQSAIDQSLLTSAATEEKKGGPEIDSEGRVWLTIATTRPETIPGDTAVAVNPKDPRYAHLIGKHIVRPLPAELPREQKLIPIIGDEHVDFEFGTGVLKVTPAHDKADFEIGQRHKLAIVDIMNPDATMNKLAGADLKGLDRFKARKVAEEKLTELGALVETKPYENNVGFSQRADVPIEPRLSEQWFLKYPAVEQSKACVEQEGSTPASGVAARALAGSTGRVEESGDVRSLGRSGVADEASATAPGAGAVPKMHFHPQRWAKTYDHWLANIQDWCISRQLWWGHRIPVWYDRLAWSAFAKTINVVTLTGNELSGTSARELRHSAWRLATQSGFLRQKFKNRDTGWEIYVNRKSLEHGFANQGLVNIQLVPGLPDLLNSAVLYATEPHVPPIPQVRLVHKFVGALRLRSQLHRVKFTVKELLDGKKLYDHQAVVLQKNEADGNSPGTHLREEKLVTRPASASPMKVAELFGDVNTDENFLRCQIESPGARWEQDPDVLDTWFSSWLWPFATMGWPEQTDTLKKFYPTTDLVTGPDIIFFWVARMIMAGYEYMGELPFKNVYFTGIVRDKKGDKMSKTKGNSPDPIELIAQYGADALRFGTMRSAPLGQDVLFDEKDVELGRNFCNKLWNACRFRQMVGQASSLSSGANEGVSGGANQSLGRDALGPNRQDACSTTQAFEVQGEINSSLLTNDDKWILLKLHQAIKEITAALAEYKFNEATAALYRFFWSEYCDWYVEASKAVLGKPTPDPSQEGNLPIAPESQLPSSGGVGGGSARRANTVAVIDFVLSHTLRLFHPFLPFITEELWHGMGYASEMPENQGGSTIMNAPWPKPFDGDFRDYYGLDDCYREFAQAKYDLVSEGRNLRRIGNIQAAKKVKFVLKPARGVSTHDAEVIKLMLNADALEILSEYAPKKGTPTAHTAMGELFLPLEGLVDVAAEKLRLTKEREKFEGEIAKVEQKLANPNFTQKVPSQVLQEHQQRLAEWQSKLDHVKTALEALG